MAARQYSNKATPATLGGGISSSDTSLSLSTVAGLPASFPYTLVIEPDSVNAEVVSCTALAGTIATVTRGQDGTTAVAHSAGSDVFHDHSARDFQEPQDHIVATAAHGATGAVVGTTNSQTLTNKTVDLASNTVTGTKALFNTALSDGDFASQAGSETLTNKTVALGSNTVSGTTAQFNTANTDGDFATIAGSETLTNKSLTAPTLTGTTTAATVNGTTVTASTHVQSPEVTGSTSRTQRVFGSLTKGGGDTSQSIATNSTTKVTYGISANTSGDTFASVVTDDMTVPIDGIYLLTSVVTVDTGFADKMFVQISVDGNAVLRQNGYGGPAGAASSSVTCSGIVRLNAAGVITTEVLHRAGVAANAVSTILPGTYFTAYWIGPLPV